MPAQANGSGKQGVLETKDGETFLFTSESVGEGHPGKQKIAIIVSFVFLTGANVYFGLLLKLSKTFAFYFSVFLTIWVKLKAS